MHILINRTYEIWSYDAVEAGDTDERGFEFEAVPHTFSELVWLMERHEEPSTTGPFDGRTWFSSEDEDYRTGERTIYSIHLATPDDTRAARYWIKAAQTAARRRA